MDIVNRLKLFMNASGLSSTQFADKAGIPRPTLSQILNGRNKKISNELISKLHIGFPQLNIMWLMFGDGRMTDGGITESSVGLRPSTDGKYGTEVLKSEGLFSSESHPSTANSSQSSLNSKTNSSIIPNNIGGSDSLFSKFNDFEHFAVDSKNNGQKTTDPKTDVKNSVKPDIADKTNPSKKVALIMVCYTDNSFEVFKPDREQ